MNHCIDGGDCRTAPATPGLLNIRVLISIIMCVLESYIPFQLFHWLPLCIIQRSILDFKNNIATFLHYFPFVQFPPLYTPIFSTTQFLQHPNLQLLKYTTPSFVKLPHLQQPNYYNPQAYNYPNIQPIYPTAPPLNQAKVLPVASAVFCLRPSQIGSASLETNQSWTNLLSAKQWKL